MKKAMAVAKVNFRTSRLSYQIFGVVVLSVLINSIVTRALADVQNYQVSPGSYAYLLVLLFAIFIPALHFRKFMNLNVTKSDYIRGCAATYVGISLLVSALNTLSLVALDGALASPPHLGIWNLMDIFGWTANGLLVAFFQQFAFLLLLAAFTHLLTTLQTFWYGWVIDLVLGAVIAVFTPIPPLRGVLVAFFGLILFNANAPVQIALCLALSVVLYLLSIVPVKQKTV